MKRVGFLFLLAIALVGVGTQAQAAPSCNLTHAVAPTNYPGAKKIPNGNNLLLPAGKAVAANGQKLVLIGRVLDNRCMPIPGAIVELWQVDPFGQWLLAGPDDLVTPNPVFAGAGRATTDTEGQFQFITAFPAALPKRAPHLNVKIVAQGLPSFSTVLFFGSDNRNGTDRVYKSLSLEARAAASIHMGKDDDGDLTGMIDIVLPGRAPYRTY